jgi:hypothetical protein
MSTEPSAVPSPAALEAGPPPLRLLAEDEHDLRIISAALQDAILRPVDIVWERAARRVTMAVSRFCWECGGTRVMAAMQFGDVEAVRSRDLDPAGETPLELLAIHFQPGEAPGGEVVLMFAGGGDLAIEVDCVDAVLADLTDRWPAQSAPNHPVDGEDEA